MNTRLIYSQVKSISLFVCNHCPFLTSLLEVVRGLFGSTFICIMYDLFDYYSFMRGIIFLPVAEGISILTDFILPDVPKTMGKCSHCSNLGRTWESKCGSKNVSL